MNDIVIDGDLIQSRNSIRWRLDDIRAYVEHDKDVTRDIIPYDLFKKIRQQYKKYIDFPEKDAYDFLALWDIGTYFFSLFNSFPYIHLTGLRNTAKRKVMTLSSNISFNGKMFGGITNAVLFRVI